MNACTCHDGSRLSLRAHIGALEPLSLTARSLPLDSDAAIAHDASSMIEICDRSTRVLTGEQ